MGEFTRTIKAMQAFLGDPRFQVSFVNVEVSGFGFQMSGKTDRKSET